ncbi:dihydrolipoyl dehydrogenase [Candidatus Xianfuyuplasma coldseepsis]|uniref:Dihydrolipoyl dehydrogenase n=1 Tax=Candidatus Xianfuyuplasma coldseepsis TaxID=2782163 RepID=A0A7L7KVC5_9MOLU|nr:dihydrolipoyl dehydrogenase [Xianfuyuplasma coldseepsis]QMS85934.1 dihydrolipoyl dehydrogenase [Xianfuyuplasma coldseepsis]
MRDVVIIGAGPGGFDTAIFAKEHGLDVVLVEENIVGGTCLNWGCIPTKALYHNAKQIAQVKEADTFGIHIQSMNIDYDVIKERKESIVSHQVNNIETSLKRLGVELIQGTATIKDANTVVVNGTELATKHIIIATGSSVRKFPFKGDTLMIIHDSKDLLDLHEFPKRLLVVGAGVIGCEMASIFQHFDAEVTLVEYQKEILPPLDQDIQKRARNLFKRKGLTIHTSATLDEIRQVDDEYVAFVKTKKGIVEIPTDYVLLATGRQPNFGGINLEQLGIDYQASGIVVNDNKQTSIDNIYAIGDVNGELMLAHKATYDGYKAISHMLNQPMDINFDLVPSVVFSFPEIASIGKTEEDLQGTTYHKSKYMYKTNAKAQCMNETDGFIKMLANEENVLVGCHIIGAHAADLIHEVGSLMYTKISIDSYRNIIHAHPTLSEIIGECIKGFEH